MPTIRRPRSTAQARAEPVAMNTPSDRKGKAADKAASERARQKEKSADAGVAPTGTQQGAAGAEPGLNRSQAAQLVEANEQLVRSALRAQSDAEASASALEAQSLSVGLDPLTALPNRTLFFDRFTQAIAHARRHGGRIALLFLDMDNFQQINDALGHGVGDEVLRLAAHRIVSSVSDVDTVSRHGGDEFLVLLTDVSQAADAVLTAEKLLAAVRAPTRVGDHVFRLAASIGISLYPDDGEDTVTLIERADAAMYQAKRLGQGSVACHGEQADERRLVSPALAALQTPFSAYEQASAEHERRLVELREANQQLVLSALDARNLLAAAEKARARQKEFLAVTAHELRNPLASISLASTMLAQEETQDPSRIQDIIERQVTHMARLIEDMLDLSRVHTGKLRLERCPVDLARLIDEVVVNCRPAMDKRLQDFSVRMPPRVPELDGDPARLAQVFGNLLDNASKYTPEGGRISLVVQLVEDSVVVTVSDSGIGITAEVMPSVFEPFVQDSSAIGLSGAGLGIGLTVVRELVEAHGGTVTASSAGSGLGSQFVVTLPLHR
ncbi:MAG TPA: diguanylate cyclase [Xanthomonadaceae bacterium]|nr:diguanylate cyclase [Xanthomonadaceae bacterium]